MSTVLPTFCGICGPNCMMYAEDIVTHIGDFHGVGAIVVMPASKVQCALVDNSHTLKPGDKFYEEQESRRKVAEARMTRFRQNDFKPSENPVEYSYGTYGED